MGQTSSFAPGQIDFQLLHRDERETRALAHMALTHLGSDAKLMVEACARKLLSLQNVIDHASALSSIPSSPISTPCNLGETPPSGAGRAEISCKTNKQLFLRSSIARRSREKDREAERAVIDAAKDQLEVIESGTLVQYMD